MPSDAGQQRCARSQHFGRQMQPQVVQQPVAQARPDRCAATHDGDVLIAGGRAGTLDRRCRPAEDEGEVVGPPDAAVF